MAESYPFPVYSGVLEPEHYKRIGNALWLFLWCISATTEEVECEGVKWGQVLGRKPIKIQELQEVFGVKSDKTIRNWIEALETNGYIKVTRSPYGLIFEVNKSKKFRERSVENYRSGSVKDYRTEDRDRQKITDHPVENYRSDAGDRYEITDHSVKNYRSNKDITEDIYINSSIYLSSSSAHEENAKGDGVPSTEPNEAEISSFRQIEAKYIQRRARGFDLMPNDILVIEQLLQDDIPVETILQGIDKAFDEYKPRFRNDRIKSMTYCEPIIRELHYLNENRKEANERAKTRKSAGHGRDSQESGGSESDSKGYFERFDGLIQSL